MAVIREQVSNTLPTDGTGKIWTFSVATIADNDGILRQYKAENQREMAEKGGQAPNTRIILMQESFLLLPSPRKGGGTSILSLA